MKKHRRHERVVGSLQNVSKVIDSDSFGWTVIGAGF